MDRAELRRICDALNDERGTGDQSGLARRLESHVPGTRVDSRTVGSWVAGRTTPCEWHLEQMRGIREGGAG